VVLLEARKKFPLQSQTLELCKYVIVQLTKPFLSLVEAGRMRASAVLNEHGGGMADLLRLICLRNYGGSSMGGLSDRAYRVFEEARQSEEWLMLANTVSAIEQSNHASSVQQSEITTAGAATTANPAANSLTREQILRPILEKKGFSIHDWATAADVDFHTANNYLKGHSNPYQSTRKKLADALGIAVEDLPA
jgi:hypothetical protein